MRNSITFLLILTLFIEQLLWEQWIRKCLTQSARPTRECNGQKEHYQTNTMVLSLFFRHSGMILPWFFWKYPGVMFLKNHGTFTFPILFCFSCFTLSTFCSFCSLRWSWKNNNRHMGELILRWSRSKLVFCYEYTRMNGNIISSSFPQNPAPWMVAKCPHGTQNFQNFLS